MEGYSLDTCPYGSYNINSTSLIDYNCHTIMDEIGNIKNTPWSHLIDMKEELITHMKDSIDIEEPINESINTLSNSLIQFMKDFKEQRDKMDNIEIKMKQVLEDTQKDIEIMNTFIDFLNNLSSKTDKDIKSLQAEINSICDNIKQDNKINDIKKEYIIEKQKFHQHVNLIRLLNQLNVGSTCSICLQDNVNCYFDPCGHTACSKCCEKNKQYNYDNCPLCRKKIININKLYFT